MTRRKIFGVVLDIALIALIIYMILFLFHKANEMAEESKKHWPPPGSIPEHIYEQLLNGERT